MGILDTLRSALGMSAEADATREADPEDLFGMSTAYVTMEADLDYEPTGEAALCFSNVDSTAFADARREVRAILEAGSEDTGLEYRDHTDEKGYEWVVLADDDFEDLITSLHFAADTFVEEGFGSRLLAAVFAFRKTAGDDEGRAAYWIYSFRRGAYYPFVPEPGRRERDSSSEFKLESVFDGELDVESEKEYWYPLWPDGTGHPWES
jgi:phytoene dehydrogenase-like protein